MVASWALLPPILVPYKGTVAAYSSHPILPRLVVDASQSNSSYMSIQCYRSPSIAIYIRPEVYWYELALKCNLRDISKHSRM